MPLDLVSLADASASLGVSVERVRQLVVAGDLPGVRFGNAWAVPRESIAARRQVSNRRGRPLGQRGAWEAIASGNVDLSNVSRYRNRGEAHRFEMSAADLAFLSAKDEVLVSGVAAARAFGELLQSGGAEADWYVSDSVFGRLGSLVAAVADPLGGVRIRVVADELGPVVEGVGDGSDQVGARVAPRGAVALDLMGSGDPRHWVVAESLMDSDG